MMQTMIDDNGQPYDLQAATRPRFQERGTVGIEAYAGLISEAYHAELQWPSCYSLFNRIRRSDPEISIIRVVYEALARQAELDVVIPDDANDAEKAARDFYLSELDNMDGGIAAWLEALVNYVPFYGWAWWTAVPGFRRKEWRPPGGDPWRSEADDGLIGIRRLAWRDHSSFFRWDMDDKTGRLMGMEQLDPPNPFIKLPLEESLHITFGDRHNPEGLGTLESIWRLERVKYGLETIMHIGFEHSAGHLSVKTEAATLTAADKSHIRTAARYIMTAQEGNYATWPKGFEAEIIDAPFTASTSLLEAIRYYGLLKMQLHNMQWVAIATTAQTGAFAAMSDSSSMAVMTYNAMLEGFVQQYDQQIGRRLWAWNMDRFPGARVRPQYIYKPMSKIIGLGELGQFLQAIAPVVPLGEEDMIAIRAKSGVLPEVLPEAQMDAEPVIEPEGEEQVPDEGEMVYSDREIAQMVQDSMAYLDRQLGLTDDTDEEE